MRTNTACTFGAYTRDIYRSPIFVQQHADQQRYLFATIDFRILRIIRIRRHYHRGSSAIFIGEICQLLETARSGARNKHGGPKRITTCDAFDADEVNRADIRRAHENSSHIYIAPIFTRQLLDISHGWVTRIRETPGVSWTSSSALDRDDSDRRC